MKAKFSLKKRSALIFIAKTIVSIALIILVWIIATSIWNHFHKDNKVQVRNNLPSYLVENRLLIEEIQALDVSSPIIDLDLSQIISDLDASLKQYPKQSEDLNYVKDKNPELIKRLDQAINVERQLLIDLQKIYGFYGKALAYRPLQDLGTLDVGTDSDQALLRIGATDNALQQLTASNTTSKQSGEAINSFIECLAKAKQIVEAKNNEQFQKQIIVCDQLYSAVRSSMAGEVVSVSKNKDVDGVIEVLLKANEDSRSLLSK